MKTTQQTSKTVEKTEVSKSIVLDIHDVEEESVIVNIDGWRIRLYFDKSLTEEQRKSIGGKIEAKYFGDIDDVHSLRFLPLK